MKLTITTPLDVIVKNEDVLYLQAEDATGSFGILPLHADFVTVLASCVVRWKNRQKVIFYCAVNSGILIVTKGKHISIATREAVVGHDLADLKRRVLGEFEAVRALESKTRLLQERLQAETIHRIQNYLHREGDYVSPP